MNNMHRFYHPNPLKIRQSVILEEFASHHAIRVMRIKLHDELILFNGDGFEYLAQVEEINKKIVKVKILRTEKNKKESPLKINLFQSISSNEKMDLVIQKATELGAYNIQPVFSERSSIKLNQDRVKKKLLHWNQVAISACEQSGRSKLPSIFTPKLISQIMQEKKLFENSLNLLLHPYAEKRNPKLPNISPGDINIFIGPEGGFTEDEIVLLQTNKFINIQLGPRILRTETAPLAIIAILQYKYGDFA